MTRSRLVSIALIVSALALSACSGGSGRLFARDGAATSEQAKTPVQVQRSRVRGAEAVAVNRYIWAAALDVLDFLPVQTVDPFTGVIVTGYGTPPGGGRAYRATVHVKDPALDARALSLALQTRRGAVAPATVRAVEDAILSRARQLRIADRGR